MMSERDQLIGGRLQDEKELSDKRLALSEAKNRLAIRKQTDAKIEELGATIESLTVEIAVRASPFTLRVPSDFCVMFLESGSEI
jgi:hypothetical protein